MTRTRNGPCSATAFSVTPTNNITASSIGSAITSSSVTPPPFPLSTLTTSLTFTNMRSRTSSPHPNYRGNLATTTFTPDSTWHQMQTSLFHKIIPFSCFHQDPPQLLWLHHTPSNLNYFFVWEICHDWYVSIQNVEGLAVKNLKTYAGKILWHQDSHWYGLNFTGNTKKGN